MPNSEVSRVELNRDGTINLVVTLVGFDPGMLVEISGSAAQESGAAVTFSSVKNVPANGEVNVPQVPSLPAIPFNGNYPIMVVARAAQVWVSVLPTDTSDDALNSNMVNSQLQGAWNLNMAQPAISLPGIAAPQWVLLTPQPQPQPQPQPPATTLIHHGKWWDGVKREPLNETMEGRFTRLFPDLAAARFDPADLILLAGKMTAPPDDPVPAPGADPEENPGIPAAYTYFGQFVDHDLTFDPTSSLRATLTKAQLRALVDFRTPRFDLDNLYGRGPDDQPYLYEDDGVHLLLGERLAGNPADPGACELPRGPNGRALIGDPRNDENRIVAQLHAIFLRFHNKVADHLGVKNVSFDDVREQVRWHYQWLLVNDFLPRIMEKLTYERVFPNPYSCVPTIPKLRENDLDLMPVEFSVAAYRFGHSMVRPHYRLNAAIDRPLFAAADDAGDLGGFRPIPPGWAIDWQFFIDLDHGAGPAAGRPQLSYKIDTSLVNPLGRLPARIAADPPSLALRNLERGATFQLPSGQALASALGLPVIGDEKLVIGKATAAGPQTPIAELADGFAGKAPLWAYILSEAQVTSWRQNVDPLLAKDDIPIRLGPLGGRLVAEVFASLLRGDPGSYLHATSRFRPIAAFTHDGAFELAELINVALGRAP